MKRYSKPYHPGEKVRMASEVYEDKKIKKDYQKERKEKKLEKDSEMREYVKNKIVKLIDGGMSPEEATEVILQEKDVVAHFSYLRELNMSLKHCFMNWALDWIRKKECNKEQSNDGEER